MQHETFNYISETLYRTMLISLFNPQRYNKNMNSTNFIAKKVSATETLKRMEVGQTLVISERSIRYAVLYVTAQRLHKRTDMRFVVSMSGIVAGTRVTRTA